MKMFYLALIFCFMPTLSQAENISPSSLIDEISGVYKLRFMNGGIAGEKWQSEDIVEIVPYDDSSLYIRAHLEFFNGHLCSIWGIAKYDKGAFIYHDPEKPADGTPSCTLKVSANENSLVLTDIDSSGLATCSSYCGARGSFSNYSIAKSLKRKIRYLERLKSSPQYLESVDAFTKMQSATRR